MAILSPDGLCLECAGTPNTPDPTPFVPSDPLSGAPTASFGPDRGAGRESFAPTGTFLPDAPTVTAPTADGLPLPTPPAGYEFLNRLGGGGMGVVYLAREQASQRLVAMKFLRHPGDQTSLDRFVTELRALAKLDHPNIVRVYGHDFLRADPYFTMEYAPGGPLSHAVKGAAPPAEAVRLIRVVAGAIAAAHAGDVIHRDLKPSNILLTADGTPKVADFGLAKQLDHLDSVTRASGALGTPSYMPPEQISQKLGKIGPWSDVYGLGATLYHLLTGRAPFVSDTPEEIIQQVRARAPDRLRALNTAVPAALEAIVLRCLDKNPKDRYQSVTELIADLDRYEAGQRPVAPELTRARRAKLWVVGNRNWLAVTAGVLVLLAGAFVLGAAYWPVPKPPAVEARVEIDPWDAARKELAAGRSVTLVGAKGAPARHNWRVRPATLGESPLNDGACYFESVDSSVLELFDDPGIDSYVLSMDVLYHGTRPRGNGYVGPVFGITEPDGANGRTVFRHYAVVMKDVVNGSGAPARESAVRVMDVTWIRQPTGLPLPNVATFGWAEIPVLEQRPGPWRTIRVEVSPKAIRVWWADAPGAKPQLLADLTRADADRFAVARLPPRPGEVMHRAVPPGWTPRRPLGIWAESAAVAFKNVVISTNPPVP